MNPISEQTSKLVADRIFEVLEQSISLAESELGDNEAAVEAVITCLAHVAASACYSYPKPTVAFTAFNVTFSGSFSHAATMVVSEKSE